MLREEEPSDVGVGRVNRRSNLSSEANKIVELGLLLREIMTEEAALQDEEVARFSGCLIENPTVFEDASVLTPPLVGFVIRGLAVSKFQYVFLDVFERALGVSRLIGCYAIRMGIMDVMTEIHIAGDPENMCYIGRIFRELEESVETEEEFVAVAGGVLNVAVPRIMDANAWDIVVVRESMIIVGDALRVMHTRSVDVVEIELFENMGMVLLDMLKAYESDIDLCRAVFRCLCDILSHFLRASFFPYSALICMWQLCVSHGQDMFSSFIEFFVRLIIVQTPIEQKCLSPEIARFIDWNVLMNDEFIVVARVPFLQACTQLAFIGGVLITSMLANQILDKLTVILGDGSLLEIVHVTGVLKNMMLTGTDEHARAILLHQVIAKLFVFIREFDYELAVWILRIVLSILENQPVAFREAVVELWSFYNVLEIIENLCDHDDPEMSQNSIRLLELLTGESRD